MAKIDDDALDVLRALAAALEDDPSLGPTLHNTWRTGKLEAGSNLGTGVAAATGLMDRSMPEWSQAWDKPSDVKAVFDESAGEILLLWAAANAARRDSKLAPVLEAAMGVEELAPQARVIARNRVVQGPLEDAMACMPLLGRGDQLSNPANGEALARMEILIWEAGACAFQMPNLGKWVWGSTETFEGVVADPARGSLRGRVLAARMLEVTASGMPPMTDPQLVGRTLQVLQPLLLHPEPMVWISAARALGRLAGVFEPLEGTLLDWVHGASLVLRQRALTGFASLPADRLGMLSHELTSILDSPQEKAWGLAAAAAATPHLFHGRRDIWDRLCSRILEGDGGATAARALAKGLGTLWRRGPGRDRGEIVEPFQALRLMARRAETDDIDEWRRWLEVIEVTDVIDDAERDPLDIETGLENLVRVAAQYDDEEADARAARFAGTVGPTFNEAYRITTTAASVRHRAAALNAVEGCARSLALRLWGPLLATRPAGDPLAAPNLEETWTTVARAPAELLDAVRERRADGENDPAIDPALEVLALKLGGYALDACGEDSDLGPGAGPTAHQTCLWLRKLDGLADGSRELPKSLQSALSSLFWRLVDTTRGTALGEVDDVQWLGPFAAWWALVIDRPALLQQLANALPMIADGALETCCELADQTRKALSSAPEAGAWGAEVARTLGELKASDTELAEALAGLAKSLEDFEGTGGMKPDLEAQCLQLVIAAERLQAALADPVRALHPATETGDDDSLNQATSENAPRMASVVSRAIKKRDLSLLEVWFASLGPMASTLVDRAVRGAVKRTPPPPPAPKKAEPKRIVGYDLLKALGEGGIGSVWLVRKPGADRLFVLKIPKADVLESASDTERDAILASFTEEAKALAGLYHPNVANIIDRGVEGNVPYLVLELLKGADLKQYSTAKLMSLFELRSVVKESCAGLTALHNAGLVHRDIKPANLWLRLPLRGNEPFNPEVHRDPARAQPLSTVLIDFGMVRAQRVSAEVGGKFVAGTPGYIAPEQVLDPVELDGRADVYAMAGTIYNVTTGRAFFDEIKEPRERIVAHMRMDPLENAQLGGYPAALVKLMRAATALEWKDRPTPLEFGREFEAAL